MLKNPPPHLAAVLVGLFVAFLWSTSWVFIKIGLKDVPPLSLAGVRYVIAALCLAPFLLRPAALASLRALTGAQWKRLAIFGFIFIGVTQAAQYWGLALLPAVTVSLMFNFTPVAVALLGISLLSERPTPLQWSGVLLYAVGIVVYFYPVNLPEGQLLGVAIMLVGVATNVASSIMGRSINREGVIHPTVVTMISMTVGTLALLGGGVMLQGLPTLSLQNWLFTIWIAVVNTSLGFTLWNYVQRTLSAIESSIINSTMLVQVAIMAWLFLGEAITVKDVVGMALVSAGTLAVQLRGQRAASGAREPALQTGVEAAAEARAER